MDMQLVKDRGLVLLGCGKMGTALLQGWLGGGLPAEAVWAVEPYPTDWLKGSGVHLNGALPEAPAVILVAVKPQMLPEALPHMRAFGNGGTLFLTIAAGWKMQAYADILGEATPVIRAMPNTPASIGRGITAICGNSHVGHEDLLLAEALLSAVGEVVRLEDEEQMDAVTAVSGSGPAYVFHLIEALAAAGSDQGLPPALSLRLATATVAGAGALAAASSETPAQLRENVTSPGGTTAAALKVLMDEDRGFPALLREAVAAATRRGRELGSK